MSGGHPHALHLHGHSPVHRLPPEEKLAALIGFVLAVVMTPPQAVWAFGVHALLVVAVLVVAEIPPGFFLRRLAVEAPFVMFAIFLPIFGAGDRMTVLGIDLSIAGLVAGWNIIAKATLGVSASVILVATTEIPDILRGLERLKVPRVIVAIAAFMVRYLDVIAGELHRMRVAMVARGFVPRGLGQTRVLATAGGAMFLRSYERGERVHQAMLARGYTGVMPSLRPVPAITAWMAALSVPSMAWLVALGAWLA